MNFYFSCYISHAIISECIRNRASSILQEKRKLYGPKNALDYENTSSSWNSEGIVNGNNNNENEVQYLIIGFGLDRRVLPKSIKIQFQAGFGCEQCHIYGTLGNINNNSVDNNIIGSGDYAQLANSPD